MHSDTGFHPGVSPAEGSTKVESNSEKVEEHHIEESQDKLNQVDLDGLAHQALTWKSRAVLRLAVVILLQGLSMYCPSFLSSQMSACPD